MRWRAARWVALRAGAGARQSCCPVPLAWVAGVRNLAAEQAFLAVMLGYWRWARRPPKSPGCGGVVGLRVSRKSTRFCGRSGPVGRSAL